MGGGKLSSFKCFQLITNNVLKLCILVWAAYLKLRLSIKRLASESEFGVFTRTNRHMVDLLTIVSGFRATTWLRR